MAWYAAYSWASKLNNEHKTPFFFMLTLLLGLCPFWAIVSRISKSILFDGILYDIIMFGTFAATMAFLGAGDRFSAYNWFGAVLIVIGLVLMKS